MVVRHSERSEESPKILYRTSLAKDPSSGLHRFGVDVMRGYSIK